MTAIARNSGGGFDLELELDTTDLLPGRLVDGRLRLSSRHGGAFRGARVTLVGTETWRYDQTTTDSSGHTRTATRTSDEDLPHVPIAVLGPTTVAAGDIPLETKRLLAVTEQSLFEAISHARAGRKLADLCGSVEAFAKPHGFTIVREFVGHGVGRRLHEEPQVPNYRPQGKSPTLMPGMTLAIEPMINAGVPSVRILDDGWTVITDDRKPSAHFEHTVLITSGDPEILTWRPREALPEMLGLPPW